MIETLYQYGSLSLQPDTVPNHDEGIKNTVPNHSETSQLTPEVLLRQMEALGLESCYDLPNSLFTRSRLKDSVCREHRDPLAIRTDPWG